jgi:hypothetical protein
MKPLSSTSRRLLTLDALFVRRSAARNEAREPYLTRLPDDLPQDFELCSLHEAPGTQIGRLAAEVALEEGGRRQYAPRGESEVLEARSDGRR